MEGMKLVIIGGGSVYTPEIFHEIILRRERLYFSEIVLVDIPDGAPQAELVLGLAARMLTSNGYDTKLYLTLDRRKALRGARFVISQIRVGCMQARAKDERLGISMGLLGQETTGVGGFSNALRTIPVALEIAKDMQEICPEAWLINFTNPSGIVTEAILKHSSVRCIGLCNVPINMAHDVSKLLDVPQAALRCRFMGLNHLSFITSVRLGDEEILGQAVARIGENTTLMKNIPKVQGVDAFTRSLGMLASPYLQYYYFEDQMRAKQDSAWAEHRTTRAAQVEAINRSIFAQYADENLHSVPPEVSQRGGSLYSFAALDIIEALTKEEETELVVNVRNAGAIEDLAEDDVVEINCLVSRRGVRPIPAGTLPPAVAGLVQTVKQYECLCVQAAVQESRTLAVAALLNHPLAHGFENARRAVETIEAWFPDDIHLKA